MYKLKTAPTVEPITVSELKSQLRITSTSQDTMLGVIAKAARQQVEDYLRYSLMSATWLLYLDEFPKDEIWIQKSPVTSITSIKYYNSEGVLTTLPNTEYSVDTVSKPCRVYPAYNKIWPTPRLMNNAIEIEFVAGYLTTDTDPSKVLPDIIKQAVLMVASTMYENPADEVTGTQVNTINNNSLYFLRPYRAMRY